MNPCWTTVGSHFRLLLPLTDNVVIPGTGRLLMSTLDRFNELLQQAHSLIWYRDGFLCLAQYLCKYCHRVSSSAKFEPMSLLITVYVQRYLVKVMHYIPAWPAVVYFKNGGRWVNYSLCSLNLEISPGFIVIQWCFESFCNISYSFTSLFLNFIRENRCIIVVTLWSNVSDRDR